MFPASGPQLATLVYLNVYRMYPYELKMAVHSMFLIWSCHVDLSIIREFLDIATLVT